MYTYTMYIMYTPAVIIMLLWWIYSRVIVLNKMTFNGNRGFAFDSGNRNVKTVVFCICRGKRLVKTLQ